MSATTQLLSSGQFCKLLYDTIPVKIASANVSFYTNNSKNARFWVVTLLSQMSDMYYLTMAHFGRNMLQENFPHLQWTFLVVVDGVFSFIIVLYSLSSSQRYESNQGHWFSLTGFLGHVTWVSHDPRLTIPRATFREILHLCLVSAHWCARDVKLATFTEVVETGKKRGNRRSEVVTTMTTKIRTLF